MWDEDVLFGYLDIYIIKMRQCLYQIYFTYDVI